jgi:hypothetical protein
LLLRDGELLADDEPDARCRRSGRVSPSALVVAVFALAALALGAATLRRRAP